MVKTKRKTSRRPTRKKSKAKGVMCKSERRACDGSVITLTKTQCVVRKEYNIKTKCRKYHHCRLCKKRICSDFTLNINDRDKYGEEDFVRLLLRSNSRNKEHLAKLKVVAYLLDKCDIKKNIKICNDVNVIYKYLPYKVKKSLPENLKKSINAEDSKKKTPAATSTSQKSNVSASSSKVPQISPRRSTGLSATKRQTVRSTHNKTVRSVRQDDMVIATDIINNKLDDFINDYNTKRAKKENKRALLVLNEIIKLINVNINLIKLNLHNLEDNKRSAYITELQKIENKVRVLARSLPSDGKLQKKTSNVEDRIVTEYKRYTK